MPYVEYDETGAVCPRCGTTFRSPDVLESHLRESHGEAEGSPPAPRAREVRCSVCGARLPSVTALERHNRQSHVG